MARGSYTTAVLCDFTQRHCIIFQWQTPAYEGRREEVAQREEDLFVVFVWVG